ncbi:predicted protein [Lichtheimia corymbifera JMRC:FSU:9682]|uniref:Uncharacterized protein n=1 Tax=Lichtheimia corymbifera JMRC:FSU:9682 TaxID=1263082 RepID=A0A068RJN5_9FUNG|nr:predicted protein [Lichtheimia corymbifera JMRC:FSU:9682]
MMDDDHVIAPVPLDGQERLAALQHLGASFHEGRRRISKVATPADDMEDKIPAFVDNQCVDNDDQVCNKNSHAYTSNTLILSIPDHRTIKTPSFSTLC